MKNGIITLNGNENYGNRLQNYALQEYIKKIDENEIQTIWVKERFNVKKIIKKALICILAVFIKKFKMKYKKLERSSRIKEFTKQYINVKYIKENKIKKLDEEFEKYIIGSDQIWSPYSLKNDKICIGQFSNNKLISYAASLGMDKVDDLSNEMLKKYATKDKIEFLSIRENSGKEIIERNTKRNDVQVVIDPTMLLSNEEWRKIETKPKQLDSKKYILTYFLGKIPANYKQEIEKIAKENDCSIINILDSNDKFYTSNPQEFLYLEDNAFLICTDSFHSCVFAIIFDTPFLVFKREGSKYDMNTRITNLLDKFDLNNRYYNGKYEQEILKCDYQKANKILNEERKKSNEFLITALKS